MNQESGPTPSKKKRNLYSTLILPKGPLFLLEVLEKLKILDEFEVYLRWAEHPMEELDDGGVLQPTRTLRYWKLHSHRFPFLCLVARDAHAAYWQSV
jgi:hypothetical protein